MTSKARRWWLGLAGAGIALWGLSGLFGDDDEAATPRQAVNRVWLERLPKSQRDVVGHFVLVDRKKKRIGVGGASSQWRHDVELFHWTLDHDRLEQAFPQSETKASSTIKAEKCDDAPRPFTMCLDIESADGQKRRFYSRREWIIKPREVAESMQELADDYPELEGARSALAAAGLPKD